MSKDTFSRYRATAIVIVSVASACISAIAMTALITSTVLGSKIEKNKVYHG